MKENTSFFNCVNQPTAVYLTYENSVSLYMCVEQLYFNVLLLMTVFTYIHTTTNNMLLY